jgi:hypothetical protein
MQAPEEAPPPGAEVIGLTLPSSVLLYLTGWWVEPCWQCGTWLWNERRVNSGGSEIPARVSAMGKAWSHCETTWKSPETLYVPSLGGLRA